MTAVAIDIAAERAAVIVEARRWLRTPFHHGAQVLGAGVDCVHLLAAAFEGARVLEGIPIETYPPDWFLHQDDERLLDGSAPFLVAAPDGPELADVACFRYGRAASHAGLVVDFDSEGAPLIVHAFRGRGVVLESIGPRTGLGSRLVGYYRLRRWAGS